MTIIPISWGFAPDTSNRSQVLESIADSALVRDVLKRFIGRILRRAGSFFPIIGGTVSGSWQSSLTTQFNERR